MLTKEVRIMKFFKNSKTIGARTTVMVLVLVLGLALLGACAAKPTSDVAQTPAIEAVDVRVVALKGPTAIGLVKMMDEAAAGTITSNNYEFSISALIDEVPPLLAKGEVDIAAVPANLASVLYNNTNGSLEVLAINTLGVLYLVENGETVKTLDDLRGKTIYASGKGATPEYALNYVLTQGGLDPNSDVTIEWLPEHSACVAALAQNPAGVALLPQPFVTTAQIQDANLRVALDLTSEWEATSDDSILITGVVVARKAFIEENPQVVEDFLEHYKTSVDFVNSEVDEASVLVGNFDIVPAAVAKRAIPACNIVCITGEEMRNLLLGYLSALYDQNPQAVGGKLPQDDFFYLG
jgi:NitT/TauT family transport system substrate-binding protein